MTDKTNKAIIKLQRRGVCICDLCVRSEAAIYDEDLGKAGALYCLALKRDIPRDGSAGGAPHCGLFCPEREDIYRRISQEAVVYTKRIALYRALLGG